MVEKKTITKCFEDKNREKIVLMFLEDNAKDMYEFNEISNFLISQDMSKRADHHLKFVDAPAHAQLVGKMQGNEAVQAGPQHVADIAWITLDESRSHRLANRFGHGLLRTGNLLDQRGILLLIVLIN